MPESGRDTSPVVRGGDGGKDGPLGDVRRLIVDRSHVGQRIDNFLLFHLRGLPRSRIYRLLRTGQIRVNKGRARPSRRLEAGDEIRIPPIRLGSRTGGPPSARVCRRLEEAILYEDARIVVVNKPAGLAVHRGSEIAHGVIEIMRALRPDAPEIALVHRLDRATSGCLLLAKDRALLPGLNRLFGGRGVDKRYLALLRGPWRGRSRRVEQPLRRLRGAGDHRVVVDPAGKPAVTVFRPLRRLATATLVEARLETGRMHQIRVHASWLGHAIVGDDKYGDPGHLRERPEEGGRLMLHAERLRFVVPGERRPRTFVAPPGDDFERVLDDYERRTDGR